jgi:Fe-S-cluster containining protein
VTAEEAERFGDQVIRSDAHGWAFVGELRKGPDGACIFLGPDGCSVYERRPGVCRDFIAETCGMYVQDPAKVLGLITLRVR